MLHYPQIEMPSSAKKGEVIEIKTLIATIKKANKPEKAKDPATEATTHITSFLATFNDRHIFKADLTKEISAHPFLSFHMKVTETGTLTLIWQDNKGNAITQKRKITAG